MGVAVTEGPGVTVVVAGVAAMMVTGTMVGTSDGTATATGVPLTSTIVVGTTPPGSCEASNKPLRTVATTTMPAAIPLHSCRQSLLGDACVVLNAP